MYRDFYAVLPPFSLILIGAVLGVFLHPIMFLLCLFGLVDTLGRYNDYWNLMEQYFCPEEGACVVPFEVADYYGRSRCGRWLIYTVDPHYRKIGYYEYEGYKWWHFLPDGFPAVLLKKRFWSNLLKGHRK